MAEKARIAVVYYSMYGHIATLAEEVAQGVREAGAEAEILQVPETLSADALAKMGAPAKKEHPLFGHDDAITHYDGYLFGIPTRFGSLPAQWKAWWDSTGVSGVHAPCAFLREYCTRCSVCDLQAASGPRARWPASPPASSCRLALPAAARKRRR